VTGTLLYSWESAAAGASAGGVCEDRAEARAALREWMRASAVTAGRIEEVLLSFQLDGGHVSSAYERTGNMWRYSLCADGKYHECRTGLRVWRAQSRWHGLTEREFEVAGLAAAGLSSREIAAKLLVSERTVHSHLRKVYGKLGLHGRGARVLLVTLLASAPMTHGGEI
jgi:DNA-binding CsgD family transcriptional regulator